MLNMAVSEKRPLVSLVKIVHLMGLQYAGRPKQYTGDFGVYAVKKEFLYDNV